MTIQSVWVADEYLCEAEDNVCVLSNRDYHNLPLFVTVKDGSHKYERALVLDVVETLRRHTIGELDRAYSVYKLT